MQSDPARNEWLLADEGTFLSQCVFKEYQASGPGGQKRNRKYSGAWLKHLPSGKEARDAESRSLNDNKRSAIRKLREKIAIEVRCPERAPVDNLEVGRRNSRYPLLLALLFDVLYDNGFRISDAAAELGVSTGKLSKLLSRDSRILTFANKERENRGMPKLRGR